MDLAFEVMLVAIGLIASVGVVWFVMARFQTTAAWDRSPAGRLHHEALGSWLVAKARIEASTVLPEPPVVQAHYEGRLVGGRNRRTYVREERRAVRMAVQLLPIGGGEVRTESTFTLPTPELAELAPGRIVSVLYDPRDPRRFYIDTLRRDQILLDAATMRTRQAEENHRAQMAFSPMQGPQYRG